MKVKKYTNIILTLTILFLLTACGNTNADNPATAPDSEDMDSADSASETVILEALVVEVTDTAILAEPVEGSRELASADRITIPKQEGLELWTGDIIAIEYNGEMLETYPAQLGEIYQITLTEQAAADTGWDRIPMVMVNGKLYYDTNRESAVDGRCGNVDGAITSTVDASQIPTEDNQSNFGDGFGYQYGADDTIEIYINEKWIVFEHRNETSH